jgi:hypothetical protein
MIDSFTMKLITGATQKQAEKTVTGKAGMEVSVEVDAGAAPLEQRDWQFVTI